MEKLNNGRKNIAKYKYWSELPATKHSFFLFMWHGFQNEMTIPKKFTKNFKEDLSSCCTLIGPSKNKWKVKIIRREDNTLVFTDGWEKFVRDHGVQHTDFLVFRYAGDSSFKVLVFDMSACEREGSHFAYNDDLSSSLSLSLSSNSSLQKGSDMSTRKKNVGSNSSTLPSNVFELDDVSEDSSDESEQEHEQEQEQEQEQGKDEYENQYEDLIWKSEINFDHENDEPIKKKKRGRKKTSEGKSSQVRYISKRRKLTSDEIHIASEKASDFMRRKQSAWKNNKEQSILPVFNTTLKPTNVYRGFQLTIPKEWALEYMIQGPHLVELCVPELDDQSWTVGCRWTSTRQCYLKAKWPDFVLDNNLEEHDACVFELIQQGKPNGSLKPIFNVHIFRVIDDIKPVTVSRQII